MAPKWRWIRRAGLLSALAGAFAEGVRVGRASQDEHAAWRSPASAVAHLSGSAQLGTTIFLCAGAAFLAVAAACIIAITMLIWRAGTQAIQAGAQMINGARSQQQKERAYRLTARTLHHVLQDLRGQAIRSVDLARHTEEPDDPP